MGPKLFVGGLPFVYTNTELSALFSAVGTVVSAEMVFDPPRARTRGFGFVEMQTAEEAQAAILQLNGTLVGEKKIYVAEARERPQTRKAPGPGFGEPPRRKFGSPPRRDVGYPPRRDSGFPPRRDAGFPPRRDSGFPPRRDAGYPPRRDSGSPPRRDAGYPPRRDSGFPPRRDAGYPPRRDAGYPPKRDSGFSPRRDARFPPRPSWKPQGDRPFGAASGPRKPFDGPPRPRGKRSFDPSGPRSGGSASGRPSKKEFWSKFAKKKPNKNLP